MVGSTAAPAYPPWLNDAMQGQAASAILWVLALRIAGTTECSLRARRRGWSAGTGGWRSAAIVHTSGYMSYMSSFSREWLDWDQENSRASDYLVPIYLDGMFHIVEPRSGSLAHC